MPTHLATLNIAVFAANEKLLPIAQSFAQQLQIPIAERDNDSFDYLMKLTECPTIPGFYLELHQTAKGSPGPLFIDFTAGKNAHRRHVGEGRKQTLARAIGLKANFNPVILDTTGGLGRDAFVLASLGCEVTLLERHPIIYQLLKNAIERARHHSNTSEIATKLQCIHTNAHTYLNDTANIKPMDVIYLDPMYPHRNSSAKVKKEMQYLQAIAGKDSDADELLELAIASGIHRIVVKRPSGADHLNQRKPQAVVSSKNTRYDIYLTT